MENSLAVELLNKHFISTLLVIGFSMKLWSQRRRGPPSVVVLAYRFQHHGSHRGGQL